MNGDALLYWLSHLGSGTWSRFRNATAELIGPDDENQSVWSLKHTLTDLGHVDFFVNNSQHWRVGRTTLVGLCGEAEAAFFCGARSPKMIATMQAEAEKHECRFEMQMDSQLPARIVIRGNEENLTMTAKACRVSYKPAFALQLCRELTSTEDSCCGSIEEPIGWQVRSFDLRSRRWVEERLPLAAREYTSDWGEKIFAVCDHKNILRPAPKRAAIYHSAAMQDIVIAAYDQQHRTLAVPATAPLPEMYARAACLCSGIPPRYENRELIYNGVVLPVAAALLVLAGQPHPGVLMV